MNRGAARVAMGRDLSGDEHALRVVYSGTTIASAERFAAAAPAAATDYIAPGLIDIQINGLLGVHFGAPDHPADGLRRVAEKLWSVGVTHFAPTLITDDLGRMGAALARLAAARAADPLLGRSVLGFHLEGPWLSGEDGPRGAHPLAHCRDPAWDDFRRLQEAAGGQIILVTLAPERAGALRFIERLVAAGVTVGLGHTAADRATILAAVDAGARLATHLGNAAHDRLQRHHNYIWDQLGEDRLYASLIVDGHHLPPHLVDIFLRVKGSEHTILISDAVALTGMPPGVYDGGYRQFEVRADGAIGVVGEPRLAGAGLLLPRGVENTVRFTRADRRAAWRSASATPAELLRMSARVGSLKPVSEASFVRFAWTNGAIDIAETVLAGQTVFARR